jgi:ferredoxin
VTFSSGQTILDVANENDIPIHGNCGGYGICGSCHLVVENMLDKLPRISDLENDALDNVNGVTFNMRLACQIVLNEDMDGLRVKIP